MKIGLIAISVGVSDVDVLTDTAIAAEAAGIESLWTFEHVLVPLDYQSRYPYGSPGKVGIAPDTPLLDPIVTLTHVAARTTAIKRVTRNRCGWFAPTMKVDELRACIERLKTRCSEADTDYDAVELTSMWNGQGGRSTLGTFQTLGMSRLIVPVASTLQVPGAQLDGLAEFIGSI